MARTIFVELLLCEEGGDPVREFVISRGHFHFIFPRCSDTPRARSAGHVLQTKFYRPVPAPASHQLVWGGANACHPLACSHLIHRGI